jgi:sporulation protein YlmC with PRC-barrel domain
VVVEKQEVQTILGKAVRSSAGEDMGRLVDVVVDREGQARAAVIDFGGFLGVGSRKIAVDWKALHFSPSDPQGSTITLALTRDQVKAAPEYKDGGPVVILSALGDLRPMPATNPQAQEK